MIPRNIAICNLLDELRPCTHQGVTKYETLIAFVDDRPGHDVRYAIDASKIQRRLGFRKKRLRLVFAKQLNGTSPMKSGGRQFWMERLGLG